METKIRGPVTVEGDVIVDGFVITDHDALYSYPDDMKSNGTESDDGSTVTAFNYWQLGANERVKGRLTVPSNAWEEMRIAVWLINPGAGAGTVIFSFNYLLIYPLLGTVVTGAGTTIVPDAITAPAQNASLYTVPTGLEAIPVPPDGFLGTPPIMRYSLTRTGGTLANDIGVEVVTGTRVV